MNGKNFASKISGQFASVLGGQFNRSMHKNQFPNNKTSKHGPKL